MIWLASFPRSGNTFLRIVLHEVYGIKSSAFQLDPVKQDPNYRQFKVVKTHLLPNQLVPSDPQIPVVYLVRDGRDSVVSMAHHTSDIVRPGSDYFANMREIILARHGSHFGGWGKNVLSWLNRSAIVIKFEELVADPIPTVEKLRAVMELPEPRQEKLPTFNDLKKKPTPYGPSKRKTGSEDYIEKKKKFFRRGVAGAWKDEMPLEYQKMFWFLHGDAMRALGYLDGEVTPKVTAGMRLYKLLDESFEDARFVKRAKDRLVASNWTFDEA